jgi:hypothetical protein
MSTEETWSPEFLIHQFSNIRYNSRRDSKTAKLNTVNKKNTHLFFLRKYNSFSDLAPDE